MEGIPLLSNVDPKQYSRVLTDGPDRAAARKGRRARQREREAAELLAEQQSQANNVIHLSRAPARGM